MLPPIHRATKQQKILWDDRTQQICKPTNLGLVQTTHCLRESKLTMKSPMGMNKANV